MSWHALMNDVGAQLMRDYKGKSVALDKVYTVKVTSYNEEGTYGPVVYVSQKRTLMIENMKQKEPLMKLSP